MDNKIVKLRHLNKPKNINRFSARAAQGICYSGVAAVILLDGVETIIMAPNVYDLEIALGRVSRKPLNTDLVEEVAIFSSKVVSEK